MKKPVLLTAAIVCMAAAFAQKSYEFDQNHARLSFSVTHFGVSHVEGIFKKFDATLTSSKDDLSDAVIRMTAAVKSIDTDVEMRDKDLRSNKWFDAEKYPEMIFNSTAFKKTTGNHYKLEGNITIHGVTKPIVFDVTYNGKVQNPYTKKYVTGFTVSGKLNRTDFGIGGGPGASVVGDEVEVRSNVEFTTN